MENSEYFLLLFNASKDLSVSLSLASLNIRNQSHLLLHANDLLVP